MKILTVIIIVYYPLVVTFRNYKARDNKTVIKLVSAFKISLYGTETEVGRQI